MCIVMYLGVFVCVFVYSRVCLSLCGCNCIFLSFLFSFFLRVCGLCVHAYNKDGVREYKLWPNYPKIELSFLSYCKTYNNPQQTIPFFKKSDTELITSNHRLRHGKVTRVKVSPKSR